MIDPKKFDEIADTITRALPPGLLQMREDAEKNIRAAMSSTFNKLDLVTREEFEVHISKKKAKEEADQTMDTSMPQDQFSIRKKHIDLFAAGIKEFQKLY